MMLFLIKPYQSVDQSLLWLVLASPMVYRKGKIFGPIQDLQNQKFWGWDSVLCMNEFSRVILLWAEFENHSSRSTDPF